MSLEKATLSNGIDIYIDHMPHVHNEAIYVRVGIGSVQEETADAGKAHALEHCLHLGTKAFKTAYDADLFWRLHGFDTNAHTHPIYTDYYGHGYAPEQIVQYLSEVVTRPCFPKEAIAREMQVIEQEASGLDNPGYLSDASLDYAAFGYPYGRPIIGFKDRIAFEPEELRDFWRRYYTTRNLAVVAVGATPPDTIMSLAERWFGEYDNIGIPPQFDAPALLPMPLRSGFIYEGGDAIVSGHLTMDDAFRTYCLKNEILVDAATEVMENEAYKTLRLERGIVYGADVDWAVDNHPSAWALYANVSTDPEFGDAVAAYFSSLFEFGQAAYTSTELKLGLGAVKGNLFRLLDSVKDRAEWYISLLGTPQPSVSLDSQAALLQSLTPQDVGHALDEIAELASRQGIRTHISGPKKYLKNRALVEKNKIY